MSGPVLPPIPAPLKGIQHYLKIATEHDQRDPVVSYWCRLYALQTGLKLSTKTSDETNFLMKLMDWLERTKKSLHDNEAITNNVAAQAHLENWALKLFLYADKNDRESNFGKSVIQSFYTAGLLYDVITTFGDLSEEAVQNRKYAKWKAAYIHNCLKNGETPVAGPLKENDEDDDTGSQSVDNLISIDDNETENQNIEPDQNSEENNENQEEENTGDKEPDEVADEPNEEDQGISSPSPSTDAFGFPSVPSSSSPNIPPPKPLNIPSENENFIPIEPNPYNPAPTPTNPNNGQQNFNNLKTAGGVALSVEQTTKAQKLIKWAGSALNYDDVPTTVLNLQKALHLLTTGQEMP
ncbi:vacuolar protein sorting-associated protein VTA1 homolog isoform X2 [Leptopilina heterotoma]|uniref:vacuolar protein sorting-associated protein VTA1 homolog isoform X2 n=1 Tax=Leptopilina heterotoma TaxID=63436 RepID=UPI001CA842D8|nr:vacuolar protein sorting-associated protein VTA1 homolog isoform X2 [Leptopilina heterotoma]